MSADDMMARLAAMAGGDEPVATKAEVEPKAKRAKAEPKAEPVVAAKSEPVSVPSGTVVPVVVLDDGSTFSDLLGAKVCYVSPDSEDIDPEAFANGIAIDSLLTLRDAIETILTIVRR